MTCHRIAFASLALLAAACGSSSSADDIGQGAGAATQGVAASDILVYDGLTKKDPKIVTTIDPTEVDNVLHLAITQYFTSEADCVDEPQRATLEEKLLVGNLVPRIAGKIDGSFTAANTKQTLYAVALGECGASHADGYGTSLLLVVEGGNVLEKHPNAPMKSPPVLKAMAADVGLTDLYGTYDLDGDKRNEVLLTVTDGGQGEIGQSAKLVRLEPSKSFAAVSTMTLVKDFGGVWSSDCDVSDPPAATASENSSTIRAKVNPGSAPVFTTTAKKSACTAR